MKNNDFKQIYLKLIRKEQVSIDELSYFMKHTYDTLFPTSLYNETLAIQILNTAFGPTFINEFVKVVNDRIFEFGIEVTILQDKNGRILKRYIK